MEKNFFFSFSDHSLPSSAHLLEVANVRIGNHIRVLTPLLDSTAMAVTCGSVSFSVATPHHVYLKKKKKRLFSRYITQLNFGKKKKKSFNWWVRDAAEHPSRFPGTHLGARRSPLSFRFAFASYRRAFEELGAPCGRVSQFRHRDANSQKASFPRFWL